MSDIGPAHGCSRCTADVQRRALAHGSLKEGFSHSATFLAGRRDPHLLSSGTVQTVWCNYRLITRFNAPGSRACCSPACMCRSILTDPKQIPVLTRLPEATYGSPGLRLKAAVRRRRIAEDRVDRLWEFDFFTRFCVTCFLTRDCETVVPQISDTRAQVRPRHTPCSDSPGHSAQAAISAISG